MELNQSTAKGFTLIELMVVVMIAGVLAAVGVPAYKEYIYSAKIAEGVISINAINKGHISHYNEHGFFSSMDLGAYGCVCAATNGVKNPITLVNTIEYAYKAVHSPLSPGSLNYFSYMTFAANWDSSGTPTTKTYQLDGTVIQDLVSDWDNNQMTWKMVDGLGQNLVGQCTGPIFSQLGITGQANRSIAVTFAGAAFKGKENECTHLFQALIADGTKIRSGSIMTIRE